METFHQMIKEAEDQMLQMKKETNGEINTMKENLDLLNTLSSKALKQNTKAHMRMPWGSWTLLLKLKRKFRNIFSGMKDVPVTSEFAEVQKLDVGHIVKKEITVDLSTQVQGTENKLFDNLPS